MSRRPRVLVLSAAIGQGHDGAARELVRRLDRRGVSAHVLDWTDLLPTWGRRALRDLYAPSVHHTPALFDRIFTDLEHPRRPASVVTARLITVAEEPVLEAARDVDAVVTTYPLAGQTLGALRADGRLDVPALTYLTDPAAHRLWCHPGLDEHLTVTDATAADGARYGVALRSVGPLCAPRFSRPMPVATRGRVRAELGVPDDAPLALLVSGSLGMGEVEKAVDALGRHPRAWSVVACGRNTKLRARLADRERVVTLGWRDDVPELMAAADVLVHNAGGLSFTEALVAGLPAVTYRPIPGHGRANAAVLDEAGIAPWLHGPEELVAAIDRFGARPLRRRPPRPWWTEERDASAVVARYAGALAEPALSAAG
ncbi:MGDG synthase family glycosyltransferase [Actinomycetospora succinea]|uniref:MGDG synthase family glycosyltransferase n=1 Tax=Actinomycetospora succinea TaxID=663603 RepID=UPI001FB5C6F1|nr:glycosyltransferase [Actinomycetospora succinea]